MSKNVQVFLKGDSSCKVYGILVSDQVADGVYDVVIKDEEGRKWAYLFPLSELRMVKIAEDE